MTGGSVVAGTWVPGLATAMVLCLAACGSAAPTPGDAADTGAAGAAEAPSSAAASPSPVAPARRARSVPVPEAPHSVTLPSGAVVAVRPASTTRAGLLDVPADTRVAGWWRGGSRIGDPFGSTLVAAHVDSTTQGLGPFAELLSVAAGQRVVLGSARLTQEYEIRSLRLVPQGPLTEEKRLFSPTGPRRLTLVTCAPPYDRSRGGYQNLAVVTAVPVSVPVRGGS